MKQLGNLAVVCARRPDVLLQLHAGRVTLHVGEGPGRASCSAAWDDDDKITRMIHELNFGVFKNGKVDIAA